VERTENAMAHLRRTSKRISTKIPFGDNLTEDGTTLVPNLRERKAIEFIASKRAEGLSFNSIAQILNDQAMPTKYGTVWHAATIRDILKRQQKLAA
jgi:hypothetical protein